jgi:phosphatidylinositol glycan class W
LDFTNLKAFIFTAPRTDILSQNREGIFSLLGYLAIFLAGHATGMYVLPREQNSPNVAIFSRDWFGHFKKSIAGRLALWGLIWTALLTFTLSYQGLNLQVSRRLANLPYFLWVSAFNCLQILICYLVERVCFPDIYRAEDSETERKRCKAATSRLLYAFNRNGLAIFLLANLLTGAVNLTMPTLNMGKLETMGVLVVYIGILGGTAVALDAWDISIKL